MTDKLEVIIEDLQTHPKCAHGPSILFSRKLQNKQEPELFYACSACRNRNECNFYINKANYDSKTYDSENIVSPVLLDKKLAKDFREKIFRLTPRERCYCFICNIFFDRKRSKLHKNHKIKLGISDDELKRPTQFLNPLSNDKTEAQYFFTEKTLHLFGSFFKKLNIKKIICIGAPRLHEYLKYDLGFKSFLLDLDHRFLYLYNENEFAWYNMFNNYFFEGKFAVDKFEYFLKVNDDESVLLFTDPPFGCRTELLTQTIKDIMCKYQKINSFHNILPTIWIFPYFMEIYIKRFMPEMEMSDYKINYTNHELYTDSVNGRKLGSPVRFFTNIPLNLIELDDDFNYCKKCERWTDIKNAHCIICRTCPSKNGDTYRHCKLCGICVKPNYQHCNKCGRCAQKFNHSCLEYQKHLNCWLCNEKGHMEKNCEQVFLLLNISKEKLSKLEKLSNKIGQKICLICSKKGHNEKICPKRQQIFKDNF